MNFFFFSGRIYIAGGFDGQQCLSVVEVYLPEIDQWAYCRSMMEPRSGVSVIAHHSYLYAVGGFDGFERLATGLCIIPDFRQCGVLKVANMCTFTKATHLSSGRVKNSGSR